MNKSLWEKVQPHAIALGIFFVISCIYCLPAFKGMVVAQHDTVGWKGMAQQSLEFYEKHGRYPLWTNAIFSGMPAFQIAIASMHNITIAWLHHLFIMFLPAPAGLFFLACTGFYILCMSLRIRPRLAVLGSLAYAFSSYSAVIVAVGHTTKFSSMGYAPAVLAGLILLSQRKYLLGFIVTLVFTTLLFYQNHVQIAYYTFLIAVCFAIAFVIRAVKNKEFAHLGKTFALAIVAGVLGVLSFSVILFPTYVYSKETMRGGRSELTLAGNQENKSEGGLDKDYAFGYSYGITEVLTMVVPRMYGGSSAEMPAGSKTASVFAEKTGMSEEQADQYAQSMPAYWGPQGGTSGAVYFGAAICILFVFGLVFYRDWHSGWIIAATLLGILLAWGKSFPAFNYFLFDNLPFYNKFRAPSMSMVIPQLTVPLLATLGLEAIFSTNMPRAEFLKKFKVAAVSSAILLAVIIGLYFMLDYKGDSDNLIRDQLASGISQQMSQGREPTPEIQQQAQEFGRSIVSALREDRKSLFGSDLLRSFAFIALAVAALYMYSKDKLNAKVLSVALTLIVFVDLIAVDLRYLNHDKYVEKDSFDEEFTPTPADLQIKQDTSFYRVFNNSEGDPFQLSGATSRTSYHHNSVGGYHPAKLALYDDIIRQQLVKGNMNVFNMLNTKYFVVSDPASRQPVVRQNADALGPAWFVSAIRYVDNANEEMRALDNFHPADTAILDKRERPKVTLSPGRDSSSRIQLVKNENDKVTYTSSSPSDGFGVFSEVYFEGGWKAFIDGKPVPIARVNYILRGLSIPAGTHNIEFRFEPSSYYTGDTISLIVGILSILIVLYGAFVLYKQYSKADAGTAKKI
jgi:hypothetical protein